MLLVIMVGGCFLAGMFQSFGQQIEAYVIWGLTAILTLAHIILGGIYANYEKDKK